MTLSVVRVTGDRIELALDGHGQLWRTYDIACELLRGKSPLDLIPPYNLLHDGSAGPYFAED